MEDKSRRSFVSGVRESLLNVILESHLTSSIRFGTYTAQSVSSEIPCIAILEVRSDRKELNLIVQSFEGQDMFRYNVLEWEGIPGSSARTVIPNKGFHSICVLTLI